MDDVVGTRNTILERRYYEFKIWNSGDRSRRRSGESSSESAYRDLINVLPNVYAAAFAVVIFVFHLRLHTAKMQLSASDLRGPAIPSQIDIDLRY